MPSELEALIEALEKSEGPDLGLDLQIARLQGTTVSVKPWAHAEDVELTSWRYTCSIDAALTLVPGKAFAWEIHSLRPFTADVWTADDAYVRGFGFTPAIALCIAALRARATLEQSKERVG